MSILGSCLCPAPVLSITWEERQYTGSTRAWLYCRALALLANTLIMTIGQNLVSSLATLQVAKAADVYGRLLGLVLEVVDGEQAYIQAGVQGASAWARRLAENRLD